jgi:cysteine dioxygenase
LSTHQNSETEAAIEPRANAQLTFSDLVARLQHQTAPPALEQLSAWLAEAAISSADLEPYLGFKEANYWRHRVCRNEAVEMLILCWRPGHRTPIHDHNGSHGVVKVHEGVMWETIFCYDDVQGLCYRSGRECHAGEITGAGVPDIHRLGNPEDSGKDLVTIHIYAPPLGVLRTYKVGSPNIDLYIPDESDSA